jgi:hypothetical protein
VGGTAASIIQGQQATKDAEQARELSQRQAEIANQKRIRASIEQTRIAKAQVLSSGQAQTGGFSSSGIQGGLGAATSQLGSNIGLAQTINAANAGINDALGNQARSQSRATAFSAVASLPGQLGFETPDLFSGGKAAKKLSPKAVKTFGGTP